MFYYVNCNLSSNVKIKLETDVKRLNLVVMHVQNQIPQCATFLQKEEEVGHEDLRTLEEVGYLIM